MAAGADLSPERLIDAYRHGIFPWYSAGEPILWWSPDPRMVLYPTGIRISRSLSKTLRKRMFSVSADQYFDSVIEQCRAPRGAHEGTWIDDDMMRAYRVLHRIGIAHSIEVWHGSELVGGLYGVAIGRAFFGESMFSHISDASKVALVVLARQLERWQFGLIDCQMNTTHLASMGAREIPRNEFARKLGELVDYASPSGQWRLEKNLL